MVRTRGVWPRDDGNTVLALKEIAAKGNIRLVFMQVVMSHVMSSSVSCKVDVKEGEVDKTMLEEGGGVPWVSNDGRPL